MKFRILFEAYNRLDYDVVHLTGRDHEIAARLGVLADPQPPFAIIDEAYGSAGGVHETVYDAGPGSVTIRPSLPAAVVRPPS